MLGVQHQGLAGEDDFVGVGIALGDLRTDANEAAVLELADRAGRRAGEPEQFLHLQLAPFLDDVPDVGLALGELG